MKYALLYPRVSTKKQELEGGGLGSQEARLRDYAESRGYLVDGVFRETFTGGDFEKRARLQEMLQHIKSNRDKQFVVIFDDIKRVARGVDYHLQIRNAFSALGAEVESPNFRFENSPEGRFTEIVSAAAAEYEKASSQRQTKQKMDVYWKRGRLLGPSPFGYREKTESELKANSDRFKVPCERTAPWAIEIFKQVAKGGSALSVLEKLKAAKITRKNGSFLSQASLYKILRSPFYCGFVSYQGKLYDGMHQPLISKALFNEVQKVLDQKKTRGKSRTPKLLPKLIRCECGRWMVCGSPSGKPQVYIYCVNQNCNYRFPSGSKTLRENIFIEGILAVIEKMKIDENRLKKITEHIQAERKTREESAEKMRQSFMLQLKQLDQKADRIETAYEAGVYDLETYQLKMDTISRDKRLIQSQFTEKEEASFDDRLSSTRKFMMIGGLIKGRWQEFEIDFQRRIIELFVKSLQIKGKTVLLTLQNHALPLFSITPEPVKIELPKTQSETDLKINSDKGFIVGGAR